MANPLPLDQQLPRSGSAALVTADPNEAKEASVIRPKQQL
jgi:hypothetical protein